MKSFEEGGPVNPGPEKVTLGQLKAQHKKALAALKSLMDGIADAKAKNDPELTFPGNVPDRQKEVKF